MYNSTLTQSLFSIKKFAIAPSSTLKQPHACVFHGFLFAIALMLIISDKAIAQAEICGTGAAIDSLLTMDPQLEAVFQFQETMMQQMFQEDSMAVMSADIYVIPVVVHVIHRGESEGSGTNISDAQIYSAIDDLNNRFRNANSEGVDVHIEFCLAERDPEGEETDGIIRRNGFGTCENGACYQNVGIVKGLGGNERSVKALSIWPQNDYYNIWIVSKIDNGDTVLGYAYFPGAPDFLDGSVVRYDAFGTTGTLESYSDKNTVIVHEIGHGFNLYHTFNGDAGGLACPTNNDCENDGDRLCDTPPHIRSPFGSCNTTGTNACDNHSSNQLFVHNYMDYSSEDCRTMFSPDQRNRMRCALMALRPTLMYSLGCEPACDEVVSGFDLESDEIMLGSTETIENTSTGADTFVWRLNSHIIATTEDLLNYTFDEAGIFMLCLDAIGDSCINRYCQKIVVFPICSPPFDTCEKVTNGDFEQIQDPEANPVDFSQVCGWDRTNSSPYFCSLPLNNSIGLFIYNFDIERITSSLPLALVSGRVYDLSFDYLVSRVNVESIILALSHSNSTGDLPSGSNVIAEVIPSSVDYLFQENNDCHGPYNFHHYAGQFTYNGDGQLYLSITAIPDPQVTRASIIFVDNISINLCTPLECNPEPDFTHDVDSCSFIFYGSNTGDPGDYFWNFGDGTSDTGQIVAHEYLFGGTFDVCLTISCGEFGAATECKEIEVPTGCDVCEDLDPLRVIRDCDFDSSATNQTYHAILEFIIPAGASPCDGDDLFVWSNEVNIFVSSYAIDSLTDTTALVSVSMEISPPLSFDLESETAEVFITLCDTTGQMFCVSLVVYGISCDHCIDSEIQSVAACDYSQMSSGSYVYTGSFVLEASAGELFTGNHFSPLVGFVIDTFYNQQDEWTFEYTILSSSTDSLNFPVILYYTFGGDLFCYHLLIRATSCVPSQCEGYWEKDIYCAYITEDSTTAVYETGTKQLPIPQGYTLCPQGLTVITEVGYVIINSAYILGSTLYFNLDAFIPIEYMGEEILFSFILCDSLAGEAVCQGIWFTLLKCPDRRSMSISSSTQVPFVASTKDIELTYWPNPVRDELTMKRDATFFPKADVYLADQYGRVALISYFAEGLSDISLDVSFLVSGLYFIIYTDQHGVRITDKILIIN